MTKFRNWFTCSLCMVLVFSVSSDLFAAKQRAGLSLGVGVGGMFATDSLGYNGLSNALFPELTIVADLAFVRAGISGGLIWHRYWEWSCGNYNEEDMVFLPLMADFSIMPVRIVAPESPFQIYLGGSGGILIDLDGGGVQFCVGPRIGFEFYLGEWAVIDLEGRYVIVPDDSHGELSYFNALFGIRFRIPFSKIAK